MHTVSGLDFVTESHLLLASVRVVGTDGYVPPVGSSFAGTKAREFNRMHWSFVGCLALRAGLR